MPEKPLSKDDAAEAELLETRANKLKVPREAFQDFMERMRPGRGCSFCEDGIYHAAPAPSGGTTGIVATPVPYLKGLGVWFYSATCDTCGDTRFFHANHVRSAMGDDH